MAVFESINTAWGRSGLRRRYESLAARERLLVRICLGLLLGLALYATIDALLGFRGEAVTRYLNEQRDLEWMKRNQHRVSRGDNAGGTGELLSTVVNSTAAQVGFRPRRTQTETDGVSARIEAEQFEMVLRWAYALETRHGVEVTRADIDLNEAGRVDARFSLR
ncbi:MAG: type II secretion system protein M [Gammaproteobacteria bacterium]|nr:type II secretion system protein GspM [Gammaproteobacteria bacterium]MXY55143.1 type II secretion system protein M [Gammaproteobacteria bacterium]MYF29132.1 type II secretion system protein M [Gammaproteobacteria bacterium]MYK48284.1 type II secretion system protein M [Gammaproteobacteria bacterium]